MVLSSRFAYFALRCVAQTSLRRSDDFWVGNHFDVPDVVARRLFDSELVQDVLPTWSLWRFEAVLPPGLAWPPLASTVDLIDLVWLFLARAYALAMLVHVCYLSLGVHIRVRVRP